MSEGVYERRMGVRLPGHGPRVGPIRVQVQPDGVHIALGRFAPQFGFQKEVSVAPGPAILMLPKLMPFARSITFGEHLHTGWRIYPAAWQVSGVVRVLESVGFAVGVVRPWIEPIGR